MTILTAALVATACSEPSDPVANADAPTVVGDPADAPAEPDTSSGSPTSPSTEAPPATTAASTTVVSTTGAPTTTTTVSDAVQQIEIGRSVQGRPIVAIERGTPGGRRVLVVGVIHGDEDAGLAITDRLLRAKVPEGIDLWVVPTMNPDGTALGQRTNANGVDLNRNFPYQWGPIAEPGDWQWAGTGPASEPETAAMVGFVSLLQPELGIWYHQDLYRISPGQGRDGELRARYAELTGLPLVRVTGGTYTGVAVTWQRQTLPGAVAFIVELGPALSAAEADLHSSAVLDVAQR